MSKTLSSPRVSVVIPCFNHGEFLMDAVRSVTDLNRSDLELIVVDDGSTDERTRIALAALEAGGQTVIRQDNRGLAAARNAGVCASAGEYILPLDADNRIRAAYIRRGISILDAGSRVGVVYGDAEFVGLRSGRWEIGPFDSARLLSANYIDACAIYRRAVWEQNGGYDGTMPVQGLEDWDFWIGAVAHGWEFAYVPEIVFEYRVAGDSMITRARDFGAEIEEFVCRKHGALYKKVWLSSLSAERELRRERESTVLTLRNLRRLLKLRLAKRLHYRGESREPERDARFVHGSVGGAERT